MSVYNDLIDELNEQQDIIHMSKIKLKSFETYRDCEYYRFDKNDKDNYKAYCKYHEKWLYQINGCYKCERLN